MIIGIPKEIKNNENRVGMVPGGVRALVGDGHTVYVQKGAGLGIGKIGGSAMESIARQPEAASKIQTAMIIAAALIEGVALFAVVVSLLAK